MKIQNTNLFGAVLVLFGGFVSVDCWAAGVDFSCMSYKVWGKTHVSDQFNSFDIVVQNSCPGDVYWAMCIERLDPVTHQVVETHNPTGFVEEEKKARVNLNLYKRLGDGYFRNRFQEFYVDIGYSIDSLPVANCYATSCENKKQGLRQSIKANEKAWEGAEQSLKTQISKECPDTGWDTATFSECKAKVSAAREPELNGFAEKDRELREEMAAVDPDICHVYSGELTNP